MAKEDEIFSKHLLFRSSQTAHQIAIISMRQISDSYSFSADRLVWDIRCYRHLNDLEILEFQNLLDLLLRASPNVNQEDSLIWQLEKSGGFSTKSFYSALSYSPTQVADASPFIWKYPVPPRFICFAWLAGRNRILTVDNLMKRGMQIVNICLCCMSAAESVDHLLVHCTFMASILEEFSQIFSAQWCIPLSAASLLSSWNGIRLGPWHFHCGAYLMSNLDLKRQCCFGTCKVLVFNSSKWAHSRMRIPFLKGKQC